MPRAILIGALELVSFFVVTINFRACAKGKIGITVATDVMLAGLGFQLTQMIADARTVEERIAYVIGAALGSICGMRITKRWDE
jgi:uncharacterized protein YebE (UPF0316 family)